MSGGSDFEEEVFALGLAASAGLRPLPHDGRPVPGHCLGPQRPSLRHEVVEVVEAFTKLVGLQRPVEVGVGVEGTAEVRLRKCDGDKAAAVAQHPAHLWTNERERR